MLPEVGDFDRDACSFVIRLWRETAVEQEQYEWRGWITHVQSRRRFYFQDTAEIMTFIDEYLNESTELNPGKGTEQDCCDKGDPNNDAGGITE